MAEARSINITEAAKLLRAELKRRWPSVKFSVRCEKYSMGCHMNVTWIDGPAQRMVEDVANAFSSARFDGQCDGTYYVRSWLSPDGSVETATQEASGYNRGALTPAPHPQAELVHFSGSRPDCIRAISAAYEAVCTRTWNRLTEHERIALGRQAHFPQWEGRSPGHKLASFLDASAASN